MRTGAIIAPAAGSSYKMATSILAHTATMLGKAHGAFPTMHGSTEAGGGLQSDVMSLINGGSGL